MKTMSNFTKVVISLVLLVFLTVLFVGFSPLSLKTSSQDDIKLLVKKGIDAFNNRQPDLLDEIFPPTFIHHGGSAVEGSEVTITSFYDNNLENYPDFKFTIEHIIVEGDKAAVRVIYEGTHKTYGKKIRMADHWIGRVENGKFVEAWEVADVLGSLRQLGYSITPPEQQAKK